MTAVAARPIEAVPPIYRRPLRSGVISIVTVTGLLGAGSVVIAATISVPLGLVAVVFAGVVAIADAHYNTPTRIWIDANHVVLGYWMRSKRFDPKSVVLAHNVPHDRFVMRRRGKRRSLVRFREHDARAVTRAFVAAGVEILSR